MQDEQKIGPLRIIPGPRNGRYPYCHSILVEEAGVLIDPGSDRQRLQELKEQGVVRSIWLTHWHEDHQTHLDLFPDLPLCIGEHDAPPLADLEIMLDWYGATDAPIRDYFRTSMVEEFHVRPRRADRLLRDGEVVDLGCVSVEIIHSPGHTPGHLALYFREPQVLMMGDADLTPFGPWYGDRDSSIEETVATIEKLRSIPAKVWVTSHETGLFMENPGELWDRYLQVIQRREGQLLELLRTPRDMEEIINAWIVYGKEREPKVFYRYGEQANMQKHLERLLKKGTVALDEGKYRLTTV